MTEALARFALEWLQSAVWTLLIATPMLARDLPVLVERYYSTGGLL